jgi:O-antigen ligase
VRADDPIDPLDAAARLDFAAWAIAGLLGLLPCLLTLPTDTDRILPMLVALPAMMLMARREKLGSSSFEGWLLAAAALAACAAALLAPHSARAWVATATLGCVIVVIAAARMLASNAANLRVLTAGIAIGAAAGTALVYFHATPPDQSVFVPYYSHARIFGLHQMVGCVAALSWLLATRQADGGRDLASMPFDAKRGVDAKSSPTMGGRGKWGLESGLAVLCALLTWTGLAWSGSRAAALGTLVALACWFWRAPGEERRRLLLAAIVFAVAAAGISHLLGSPYWEMGWERAFTRTIASTDVKGLSSSRDSLWAFTWKAIQASPWLGHGADGYRYLTPRQDGDQPHNFVLQFLLDFGLAGAVPFLGLIALLLWQGLRRKLCAMERAAGALLAGATVAALLDGVFYHAVVLLPVAVLAGAATISIPGGSSFKVPRGMMASTMVAIVALLGFHAWLSFYQLSAYPKTPSALPARVVRVFPSNTAGLHAWMERWSNQPSAVLDEWTAWGLQNSSERAQLYLDSALRHLIARDLARAEKDLSAALEVCRGMDRPQLEGLLAATRAAHQPPAP